MMKLIEQNNHQTEQKNFPSQQNDKQLQFKFLQPFKMFQSSVILSIKLHFIRFLFVTLVYYYSDILFGNQNKSAQPQCFLLFFLAMMIQVIKFIGDCSLRNLLKNEQNKIIQIHQVKSKTQTGNQVVSNITLKGAKFQDYMSIFSLVRIFKYHHKNYSSAFSISKYMHLICTFLVFGWICLGQQQQRSNNWLQLIVLITFLYSIYFTSFQIDLYLIQTSSGKFMHHEKNYNLSSLSQSQKKTVINNFKKWRNSYLISQVIGNFLILIGSLIDFQFDLLFISIVFVTIINIYGLNLQKQIKTNCQKSIYQIKRDQINTYSLLNKSVSKKSSKFKFFIIIQRFSIVLLWVFFTRNQSIHLLNFCIFGSGIILLVISQIKKFSDGDQLKLMSLTSQKYSSSLNSQNENQFQCAICLKVFQQKEQVSLMPCSKDHIFHTDCFQDWKKIKTQCPLCRYPLSQYI